MLKRETIEKKTEEILIPILEKMNFDLWDVEYVKEGTDYYLRAYIDKEGGININDCVDVSHKLSDALDADDFIEEAYTLEVSSPGLGRKLVKDKEFERSKGKDIVIKFYKPVEGTKEITGTLVDFDDKTLTIDINGNERILTRTDIAMVKLSVDFD